MLIFALSAFAADTPPDLPGIAETQGYPAVADALAALVAETPPKKLAKALVAAELGALSMPVDRRSGADLSLADAGPLAGCAWDGHVVCRLEAPAPAGVSAADYAVLCRAPARLPLVAVPAPAPEGTIAWTVSGLEGCWKFGGDGAVLVPGALGDLEGVGEGDDQTAPELTALFQDQAEAIVQGNLRGFEYCARKSSESGERARGKLVLAYRIAEDGSVGSVTVEMATFEDKAVVSCILDRFLRIRFPAPRGGFEGGTFPITFL